MPNHPHSIELREDPDGAQEVPKRSHPILIPLIACILISLMAYLVRRNIANSMAVGLHVDEPIVASLAMRSLESGTLSANWEGSEAWWSRPSYQFSPYTLMQQCISLIANRLAIAKNTLYDQILLARLVNNLLGSVTVFLSFVTIRHITNTLFAPIVGSFLLAIGFLHVQDCCYARVEAFLSLAIIVSTYCGIRAVGPVPSKKWAMATAISAGIAIAAKYNAFPTLLFVAVAAFYTHPEGTNSEYKAIRYYLLLIALVVVGFLAGVPEMLLRPSPFREGIAYEVQHYADGHIPYQAFDLLDNNAFYMAKYLGSLGLGYVGCLLAIFILPLAVFQRCRPKRLLASFLLVAMLMAIVPKVRFERNYEVFYCVATVAAGISSHEILSWVKLSGPLWITRMTTPILFMAAILQPAIAVYRFGQVVDSPVWFVADRILQQSPEDTEYFLMYEDLPSGPGSPAIAVIAGFTDAYSLNNKAGWERRYANYQMEVLVSEWRRYGYPFSTVDDYHGPSELLVFHSPKLANAN